jgi:hypothetical protein
MLSPSCRSNRQSAFPTEITETRLEILSGWKEIANYLHKGVRTVQRYEQEFGMPIRRVASSSKGAVIAKTVELDAWVTARPMRHAFQLPQSAAICLSLFDDIRRNIEKMERLLLEALELRLQVMRSLRVVRDDDRVVKPEARMMRGNLRRRLLANR